MTIFRQRAPVAIQPALICLSVFVLVGVGGCAASQARVQSGNAFATAGIAYVDALPAVFDESFALSVTANTHQLLLSRDDTNEDERADALAQSDQLLEERLSLLRSLREHSLLLRSYFVSLQALLSTDNASGINSASIGVLNSLGKLRPEIENATIGDAKVADLLEVGTNLVVGVYQSQALTSELSARAQTIERELSLQKQVLFALADDMLDNALLIVQIEELNPVFEEYVGAALVSDTWNEKRISAYKKTIQLESYDAIRKAAENMHSSWVALVENRSSDTSVSLLVQDVEQLLAVVRLFKAEE